MPREAKRRVCFVTGTRAEFGLMARTCRAIADHPKLELQVVATGMHLDPAHGDGLAAIRAAGFHVAAVAPWPRASGKDSAEHAAHTGEAIAHLARVLRKLRSEIVLVVGDRVEALAGATAGHLSGLIVAHVHGGDRAAGQTDDAVRHAVTKLAHVHFPATEQSARRIRRLGEEPWRIHRVGTPGLDRIREDAASMAEIRRRFAGLKRREFALVVLHPTDADAAVERRRAEGLWAALQASALRRVVIVQPNNDPGSAGIRAVWDRLRNERDVEVVADLPRSVFLGLMREAAVLVGNSSSGIIEAASFGTPVIDLGARQAGRERGGNVSHCEHGARSIGAALRRLLDGGRGKRSNGGNVYGSGGAARRIAAWLGKVPLDERLRRKLISY